MVIALDFGDYRAVLDIELENVLVQVDFLAAVVRDHGELLGLEAFQHPLGDGFGRESVDHGLGEVLAELFLQGLDVHNFHAAWERGAELCDNLGLAFGRNV